MTESKVTIYSKEFAWIPTHVKVANNEYDVIWFKFYYQKKEYNEFYDAWITSRSIKPFPKQSHLKVIK